MSESEHIHHEESPCERVAADDNLVLSVVLSEPFPWTVAELGRELDEEAKYIDDCVAHLVAAGLLHRLGEFVFPTRAARRAVELQVGTG